MNSLACRVYAGIYPNAYTTPYTHHRSCVWGEDEGGGGCEGMRRGRIPPVEMSTVCVCVCVGLICEKQNLH